jgi:PrtD family type I secretion system ABC transporter
VHNTASTRGELREALSGLRRTLLGVALFSAVVNVLMLTGPVFMLQVYDRVLASGSRETLVTLFVLVAVLFLIMGVVDHARSRALARVGARFHARLDRRVSDAALRDGDGSGTRDLDAIQKALAGTAPFAFFDMPWTPVFIALIFAIHWQLGILAVAGGVALTVLALLNQRASRAPLLRLQARTAAAETMQETLRRERDVIEGVGMRRPALDRLGDLRTDQTDASVQVSDATGGYGVFSKTMRLFLQSAILALGAWLAVGGDITPGMMIAVAILFGRALAPLEQGIAQWSAVARALRGWHALRALLERQPEEPRRTALPRPESHLAVEDVTAFAPGREEPILVRTSFEVSPGTALGVIGPSASGKSTLARLLVGVWSPRAGRISLGGASIDQFSIEDRARNVGYLPQDVGLIDGNVAENIARLAPEVDDDAVIRAATAAGAHELILRLPQGYDTPVGPRGAALSGGQRQRIALARALYGDPVLVVLDEPNASLDAEGERALIEAVAGLKREGRAVVVMAHRPSAIAACDTLVVLDGGSMRFYGPRDQVLRDATASRTHVVSDRAAEAPQAAASEGAAR